MGDMDTDTEIEETAQQRDARLAAESEKRRADDAKHKARMEAQTDVLYKLINNFTAQYKGAKVVGINSGLYDYQARATLRLPDGTEIYVAVTLADGDNI